MLYYKIHIEYQQLDLIVETTKLKITHQEVESLSLGFRLVVDSDDSGFDNVNVSHLGVGSLDGGDERGESLLNVGERHLHSCDLSKDELVISRIMQNSSIN